MAAISGVNLAMLPEEQVEFFEYLATTGEIWACWLGDNPKEFKYPPAPPAQFFKRQGKKLTQGYNSVRLLLGNREDLLKPKIRTRTHVADGQKVRMAGIDYQASSLAWHSVGIIGKDHLMDRTSFHYYTSYLKGNSFVKKPPEFVAWGRKAAAWLKKRATAEVPVYQCNDSIKATALAAAAVKKGLHVT